MPSFSPLLDHLTESLALPPVPLHLLLLQLLDFHDPLNDMFLAFSSTTLPVVQILKQVTSYLRLLSGFFGQNLLPVFSLFSDMLAGCLDLLHLLDLLLGLS